MVNRLICGFLVWLFLLAAAVDHLDAQTVEDAGVLFQEGLAHYNGGRYQEAAGKFEEAERIYRSVGAEADLYREYALSWNPHSVAVPFT